MDLLKDELYIKPTGVQTRWASFENPQGLKGQGAMENQGAKGHAFERFEPGESKVLLDVQGTGVIHRMWCTIHVTRPACLRALRLDMYWDNAETPAASAPVGDFFGSMFGQPAPLENALFSNAEGRNWSFTIPMPFRKAAKVTITNESSDSISHIFYDINYSLVDELPDNALYFHAHWRRENPTALGKDFEILPRVHGAGRFLGCHIGVNWNKALDGWWGEGEVKMYLDGDTEWPTLVGSGAEDYAGTAWGMGVFTQRYLGTTISDPEHQRSAFYRYHIPDPVFFDTDCRVTIQQIGGGAQDMVKQLVDAGKPIQPVSIDHESGFIKLLEQDKSLGDPALPEGWTNYYRQDDFCAVSFFYLERPENGLPPLAAPEERIAGVTPDFVPSK